MNVLFEKSPKLVQSLIAAVEQLDRQTEFFQLQPLNQREWYELLHRKLKPQLGNTSFLIVAVVGGTNIGKSVVFNHLAGDRVSATSPMASGTKHPTALIPAKLADQIHLASFFPGFEVQQWESSEQPLQEDSQNLLFSRESPQTPENLIILDTPDVDSVAQVNWERADAIRQSSDVLIAVLTQQKYNDAAVKEFFRKAAQEDKLVIVVFNQCLFPEDEEFWPLWLTTFCEQTGITPHAVYVAPQDRRAAEANQLTFSERTWPTTDAETPATSSKSLQQDLSSLHFAEIRLKALSGALKTLTHNELGIPGWLTEISDRSKEFQEALQLMASNRLAEVQQWPTLPNAIMIARIRQWWASQREGWTASIHGFYNQLGKVVIAPVNFIRNRANPPTESPIETYREREWEAILNILDHTFERLSWLRDLGNPLLTPRLNQLLGGSARAELIQNIRQAHAEIDFESELDDLIDEQLKRFRYESPDSYRLFRRIDSAAATVRPAVSVALFFTGAGPLGDAMGAIAVDTALRGVLHVAGDAVGGTVVTAVGDKVLTDTASTGAGYLEAKFRQLHAAFSQKRVSWMAQQIETQLFGALPTDMQSAAQIVSSNEYQTVLQLTNELKESLQTANL